MSNAKTQLAEDRALRDAARAIFRADLDNLKSDLNAKGIGGRISDRVSETAADMIEEAADMAAENKGLLGAMGVALALWFGRFPILVALGLAESDNTSGAESDGSHNELLSTAETEQEV